MEVIKLEIKEYLEINDNGAVDLSILWDSLKTVIRGKLIALAASNKKKKKTIEYNNLLLEPSNAKQQHKKTETQIYECIFNN